MSDGLFSKHTALNAGTIPASAEELSQRYAKLFQQYSRLKAQHAVLKKAVIKEQASNVALQGNVKEKEKELRKLQEQLDLLSFHNERLTKRIQAVQESDQKGSHFSLLGGSVKKELEKSAQALDAANLDLERKIRENEILHEELTERQFEFTNTINNLLKQIQDLEEKVQELETGQSLQPGVPSQEPQLNTEEQSLMQQIDVLKSKLAEKTSLLNDLEDNMQQNDARLLSEIDSLRAILLAKVGDIKNVGLNDILPEDSSSLKELEEEAKKYFQSIQDTIVEASPIPLPHEIAEKLAISHATWRKEHEEISVELKKLKDQLSQSLENEEKGQAKLAEYENEIKKLNERYEEHLSQVNNSQDENVKILHEKLEEEKTKRSSAEESYTKAIQQLEELNGKLEEEKIKHASVEEGYAKKIQQLEALNEKLEKENTRLQQEIELIHINRQPVTDNQTQTETIAEQNEEKFIYPTKEEEEEEEVFVYTGMDAPPAAKEEKEDEIAILKTFYEQKINNLSEKLQMTDSKALRFANMYKMMKERLASEEKEKQQMFTEIEKLNKELKHVQDLLATTESNYQKQIDAMTEYITNLQQSAE
ncbi:uncharacterized protein RHIMIDRAFT_237621 [Rhizopus microsporus ATCC 52813]|uniref:Protein phosphatase 1 regulatory subunit 21 N-terminal domain-containing protein n=1 Tax=Rhizopus microsporus ATCC 52813 TaxID=1340429 RepID=A0A2G4SVE3_RHIZD|nr:uncharacterized protein RHIMIDRAFT_237621 [Rhizopus microsporus ATCC 52813]PHZ12704.1 hypothetical protein RHIMIDRAFT_237621 [Rhizopus microsporus ATCC 52813]